MVVHARSLKRCPARAGSSLVGGGKTRTLTPSRRGLRSCTEIQLLSCECDDESRSCVLGDEEATSWWEGNRRSNAFLAERQRGATSVGRDSGLMVSQGVNYIHRS